MCYLWMVLFSLLPAAPSCTGCHRPPKHMPAMAIHAQFRRPWCPQCPRRLFPRLCAGAYMHMRMAHAHAGTPRPLAPARGGRPAVHVGGRRRSHPGPRKRRAAAGLMETRAASSARGVVVGMLRIDMTVHDRIGTNRQNAGKINHQ